MLRSRFLWRLYGSYAVIVLVTTLVVGTLVTHQVRRETLSEIEARVEGRAEDLVEVRIARARNAILAGAGIGASLALLLGIWMARRVTGPIIAVTDRAERLAGTGPPRPGAFGDHDEIDRLTVAFQRMDESLAERMERLDRERGNLAAVLGSMVEGVVALDDEERIVHMNEAARRLLRLPSGELEDRRIWELVRSRPVLEALRAVTEDRSGAMARAGVELEGQFLELHAAPIRGGGAVLVAHDLTELRRLEGVRRDFVANVSHELKTPVSAIVAIVETILDDDEMPHETRRHFLQRAQEQGRRLALLVTDLLALSRLEARPETALREPVDLARVAADALAAHLDAGEMRGLELRQDLEPGVAVAGDAESLRQAIDNLLSNAMRYTPEGGRVELRLHRADGWAVLEVVDTGIGIEPRHQQRIFERFYRVDSARSREIGGTGLGLAIVKHVARTHGGEVSVDSRPGRGSTFRLRFPLAPH